MASLPTRILAPIAISLLALTACGESADTAKTETKNAAKKDGGKDTLVIAGVPSEESSSLKAQFEVLGKLIEKETGKKVEITNATDYAAVIEGQRAGKIDISMMGPFSYVIGKDSGVPFEPMGALAKSADATPGYYSMGWVKKGSDIKKIEDFKGKKICFVDVASTSGYLYPSAGLLSAKIDPEKDVTPVMAGGHDASMLSIRSGNCDAGFAYEAMKSTLVKSGQIKDDEIESVWKSEQIAGSPIVVNTKTLDKDTVAKLKEMFATKANKPYLVKEGICESNDKCPLPEDSKYGFKPVKDSDYDGVRKVCEVTKAKACQG